MKRRVLLAWLQAHDCIVEREGHKHTQFFCRATGKSASVPRHSEINTFTAHGVCRDLDIPIITAK